HVNPSGRLFGKIGLPPFWVVITCPELELLKVSEPPAVTVLIASGIPRPVMSDLAMLSLENAMAADELTSAFTSVPSATLAEVTVLSAGVTFVKDEPLPENALPVMVPPAVIPPLVLTSVMEVFPN